MDSAGEAEKTTFSINSKEFQLLLTALYKFTEKLLAQPDFRVAARGNSELGTVELLLEFPTPETETDKIAERYPDSEPEQSASAPGMIFFYEVCAELLEKAVLNDTGEVQKSAFGTRKDTFQRIVAALHEIAKRTLLRSDFCVTAEDSLERGTVEFTVAFPASRPE